MNKFVKRVRSLLDYDPVRAQEEAHLNEATSAIDLEFRHRQIDRGLFRNKNRWGM